MQRASTYLPQMKRMLPLSIVQYRQSLPVFVYSAVTLSEFYLTFVLSFFQKWFFVLVSKQIKQDIPANRVGSLSYWHRSVYCIYVTLTRHFAFTWFQKKGENATISKLDIQYKVLDTIDFLWKMCVPASRTWFALRTLWTQCVGTW